MNANAQQEKKRSLDLWRERLWSCGRSRVAWALLHPDAVYVSQGELLSPSCGWCTLGLEAKEQMAGGLQPHSGVATLPHQGTRIKALRIPDLGVLLWLLRILSSCGSISQKEKNNLKEEWIAAIESSRECLMAPLINDSGSQWDVAFSLMPCHTPEAHCNKPIKHVPSSLSALAQNTPEFNVWWMAKLCL